MVLNILFIGDVVGKPGMDLLHMWLPGLKKKYNADLMIVNGENAQDGKGCTELEGRAFFNLGFQVITGGNHTWDKHQSQEYLRTEPRYIRPLNYPKGCHGNGYYIANTNKGKVAVVSLQGRAFMATIDCPFRAMDFVISKISTETKNIIVDFHAEATAEKIALAHYLDGRISALFGTHTHVQTSDERLFPNGTAFITDVGMTGPYDSVIGMKKDAAINRFIYQTPQKYQPATDNNHICGVFIKVNSETGKALEIERIFIPEFDKKII